jgi:hypothetical protein
LRDQIVPRKKGGNTAFLDLRRRVEAKLGEHTERRRARQQRRKAAGSGQGGRSRRRVFAARENTLPAVVTEDAERGDVLLVDPRSVGERGDCPRDALLAQKVQHGIRRATGEMSRVVRLAVAELVVRMKTRDLELPREAQCLELGVREPQKVVVVEKIPEHARRDEEHGIDLLGVRQGQRLKLAPEIGEQRVRRFGRAHRVADLVLHVHALRKGTESESDHGAFQPVPCSDQHGVIRGERAFEHAPR